jgi:hypothetical protein
MWTSPPLIVIAVSDSSLTLPCHNCRTMEINKKTNNSLLFEVRKVQDTRGCLMISIPKKWTRWLRISKGTPVKIQFDSDEQLGNRLIISKVNLWRMEEK